MKFLLFDQLNKPDSFSPDNQLLILTRNEYSFIFILNLLALLKGI